MTASRVTLGVALGIVHRRVFLERGVLLIILGSPKHPV